MLNDRPLTYVSSDSKDKEPLTPSHLVYGRRIIKLPLEPVPEGAEENDPSYGVQPKELSKRTTRQAGLVNEFWKIWSSEYLTALRGHHQATAGKDKEIIQVGDAVLVHDEGS
jgi:hypothetical protein